MEKTDHNIRLRGERWLGDLREVSLEKARGGCCVFGSCDVLIKPIEPSIAELALCTKSNASNYTVTLRDSSQELFRTHNRMWQICQPCTKRYVSIDGEEIAVIEVQRTYTGCQKIPKATCYLLNRDGSPTQYGKFMFQYYLSYEGGPCCKTTDTYVTRDNTVLAKIYPTPHCVCGSSVESVVRVEFTPDSSPLDKLLILDAAVFTFEQSMHSTYNARRIWLLVGGILLVNGLLQAIIRVSIWASQRNDDEKKE